MAIRGDNIPPNKTPGSITQTADSQIDRIGNISNVSKTVSNMQQDVKQRITETKQAVDEGQQISTVQKSMTTVLDKLADTVGALSSGVKTITVDTAKATKDSIAQYGKAISEDISFNKQHTVAMALAKTTPIYGYFAAKFMETDVFKKAAERMKTSIGKVFGSLAGIFRRGKKGAGEDTAIPKMQSGGYVKKGGLAEVHAGEVVAPIEKILKRIDDSITTTKDLAKITEKTALHMTTDLRGYIKSSSASDKSQMNIFRSFIRTYKEVGERAFTEQPVERMARSLLAIQDTLGAQIGNMEQVWQEMLANHPTLVKLRIGMKAISGSFTAPYRIFRAFMRVRGFGGYRTKLSKAKNPMQATAENIATLYVDLMWRLDNMLPIMKLTAEASRDTASKLTGKSYKRVKGIPKEKTWSINQVASAALGLIPGLAIGGLGKGVGKLGSKIFKGKTGEVFEKGGDITGSIAKWLITGGGPQIKSKGLLAKAGAGFRDLFIKQEDKTLLGAAKGHGPGTVEGITVTIQGIQQQIEDYYKNFFPIYRDFITQQKEITEWKLSDMRNEIERKNLEHGVLLLEHKKAEIEYPKLLEERKNKKKEKKRRNLLERAAQSSISMGSRLRKFLTKDRIWKWVMMIGGILSSVFTGVISTITSLFAPGGIIASAIMGIGPKLAAAVTSGPFWAAIAAAGIGALIGTWINDEIVKPWLDKKEKEKRKQVIKHQQSEDKRTKEALKAARTTPDPENVKQLTKQYLGQQQLKLKRLGISSAANKSMQGFGILGESSLLAIQTGMEQYRNENMQEYLLYDAASVLNMREKWDKEGRFRTRRVLRGEGPFEYGKARETAFLNYLRVHGDDIKVVGNLDELGPILIEREKKKKQLELLRKQQKVAIGFETDQRKLQTQGKVKGLRASAQRKLIEYEVKLFQKINKGKGIGKNWWRKLDSKSRAAFEEAKLYFINKFGVSEVQADAMLQDFAMKVGSRYDLMTNPEVYKQFGKDFINEYSERKDQAFNVIKSEYKERLPQVKEAKNIIVDKANLHFATVQKLGKEVGEVVVEQTERVVDATIKTGAQGSAILVETTNNVIESVSNNSSVQTGMDRGKQAGVASMEFFNNINFVGAFD